MAVSTGLVGAHQNHPRLKSPCIPPPQTRPIPAGQDLGARINQSINQAGGPPAQVLMPLLTPSLHQLAKAVQVLRLAGIHGHYSALGKGRQTGQEAVAVLLPVKSCDRRLRNATAALLFHPCRQATGAIAEAAVPGIAAEVDGLAMEKVMAADRGAATR